jgi:hypothetical protein
MPTSQEYRRRSRECSDLALEADAAGDGIERDTLARVANLWTWLANHKAKTEGRQPL